MKATGNDERRSRFSALYRYHVGRVYAYCYRRCGNRADAEDLTEQVFAEAWEKFASYEEQGRAAAWLFSIAHSRVVDYYRRRRQHLPFDEARDRLGGGATPEQQLVRREQSERLAAHLDALDDEKRELILLRFGGELTYGEIGAIVGKSEAAVKMSIYRILEQLRATWTIPGWQRGAPEQTAVEDDNG